MSTSGGDVSFSFLILLHLRILNLNTFLSTNIDNFSISLKCPREPQLTNLVWPLAFKVIKEMLFHNSQLSGKLFL